MARFWAGGEGSAVSRGPGSGSRRRPGHVFWLLARLALLGPVPQVVWSWGADAPHLVWGTGPRGGLGVVLPPTPYPSF